jgi:hypothetical protein
LYRAKPAQMMARQLLLYVTPKGSGVGDQDRWPADRSNYPRAAGQKSRPGDETVRQSVRYPISKYPTAAKGSHRLPVSLYLARGTRD